MTRRAAVPKREFLNALDAALARLPVGSFKISVENGHAAILTTQPASDLAENDDDLDVEYKAWRAGHGDG